MQDELSTLVTSLIKSDMNATYFTFSLRSCSNKERYFAISHPLLFDQLEAKIFFILSNWKSVFKWMNFIIGLPLCNSENVEENCKVCEAWTIYWVFLSWEVIVPLISTRFWYFFISFFYSSTYWTWRHSNIPFHCKAFFMDPSFYFYFLYTFLQGFSIVSNFSYIFF